MQKRAPAPLSRYQFGGNRFGTERSKARNLARGDATQNWLILKNGDHAIGLFQGMLEKSIPTFNPGWDSNAQKLASFTDVRDLQAPAEGTRGAVASTGG